VNLLARLKGVVSAVLIAGDDAPLLPHVAPLSSAAHTLQAALLEGAAAIDGVPVHLADGTTLDYEHG
jgi:hypothetical protein